MIKLQELQEFDKYKLINIIKDLELKILEHKKNPSKAFIKKLQITTSGMMIFEIPFELNKYFETGKSYTFYIECLEPKPKQLMNKMIKNIIEMHGYDMYKDIMNQFKGFVEK